VLVVVALGGNAFNRPGDPITQETHLKNADIAARIVAKIVQEGNQVLLTHGNGPQVGYLAELQKGQEGFRLDALVAATQGLLGYFLVSSLDKYVGMGKTVALMTSRPPPPPWVAPWAGHWFPPLVGVSFVIWGAVGEAGVPPMSKARGDPPGNNPCAPGTRSLN